MTVSVVYAAIDVDLECDECGHEWQETIHEEHVENAVNREVENE